MAYQEVLKSTGKFGGKYLGKIFGFFFLFLFIVIPLIYAITISIQAKDVEPGFSYLAPKLIAPVQSLETQSLIAIEQKGTYIRTGEVFKDIGRFLIFYWVLLGSIYIIYKWIKILTKIMPSTPFSNNASAKMTNITLAITIFIIIQMIFLGFLSTQQEDVSYWNAINTPFRSIYNFARAFPFFISEVASTIDPSIQTVGNITDPPPNETEINDTFLLDNLTNISIDTSKSSIIIY